MITLNNVAYTEADMPEIYTKQELKNRLEDWLRHPAKQMFARVFLKGTVIWDDPRLGLKRITYYDTWVASILIDDIVELVPQVRSHS